MWCYLFIACFDWKIGAFQQTVVRVSYILKNYPTNTPRGFHVETTWKWSLPRHFNVKSTWCVCRYSLFSSKLSSKNNRRYSKKPTKNKYVCLNRVIRLITMKMKLKMKNRSHRYGINRPRLGHGHKYTRHKMFLGIMVVICIKEHLSNIWSSIHEKVKQHWNWVEKNVAYKKSL